VSNLNPIRPPGPGVAAPAGGSAPSTGSAPRLPAFQAPPIAQSNSFPSIEGTAILNLTSEQFTGIRKLLIGLRLGKSLADDVRSEIFGMLTKGQRRVLGAAWFILSVRV
jgi:hypothetical protein